MSHGAQSEAIVVFNSPPVVAELIEKLTETVDYLAPPDMVLIEGLARKIVQRRLVWAHLDRLGGSLIDSRGRARGSWKLLASLDHGIREDAKLLGLGPATRAQLVRDMAGSGRDLVAVQAMQNRLRESLGREPVKAREYRNGGDNA